MPIKARSQCEMMSRGYRKSSDDSVKAVYQQMVNRVGGGRVLSASGQMELYDRWPEGLEV